MPSYGAYFAGCACALPVCAPHAACVRRYNIAKEAAFSARDAYAPRVPDAALYFFSGIVADVTAMPLWVPVDVVMQRMALQNVGGGRRYSSYKGAHVRECMCPVTAHVELHIGADAVQTIRAEEGLRGFYKGIGATVWTYAPSSAVWWAVYETVLPLLHRARGNKSGANDHLVHGAGGFLAGASAAASTHPLDVVKTRLQVRRGWSMCIPVCAPPCDLWICRMQTSAYVAGADSSVFRNVRALYKAEGFAALWRGLVPHMLYGGIGSAATFIIYEQTVRWSLRD